MDPDQSCARGAAWGLTRRHAVVLSAHLAILFLVVVPFFHRSGQLNSRDIARATLMVSIPLLALLELAVDRNGPLKNWAVSVLLLLFYPSLILSHDYNVLLAYWKAGVPQPLWATLLVNAAVAAYCLPFMLKMAPRVCPGCRRRTMIPLIQLLKDEKRSSNTSWCASCGGKFWKDRQGAWRPERRITWLDQPTQSTQPTCAGSSRSGARSVPESGHVAPAPPTHLDPESATLRERPQTAS